ncbi:CIR protein [Plasmodium chabaudi chabaudi]|uniref:CIR protein n=1 Tax=Plasmodium chabaudi chabaudi TaxID=31271 RepID=A0A1D3L7W8_PLACU|nr:CIR protein [Plasmodium chabaudi chabaudi]
MTTKQMCNLFREADGYFNDENVDTQKFNKNTKIKRYCSSNGCKTNEDHINALTLYIHMEFKNLIKKKSEYNKYDECLLMWLSDKLYKMHLESIGKKDEINYMDGTTLNEAYKNYLEKHKKRMDYWDLLGIMPGLKEANLKYMTEFYKLINHICKIIKEYNDKGAVSKKLSKYSVDCRFQYRTLYMNIYECKSYLHLLNRLKGLYDDFRGYAIKNTDSSNDLANKLQKLTLKNGVELNATKGFKSYNFSNQPCKGKKKKKTDKPSLQSSNQLKDSKHETLPTQKPETKESKLQSSPEPEPEPAPPSPKEPQPETQQSSSTTSPEDPPTNLELHSSSQESQELGKNNQNALTDSGKETGGSKSEIKGPEVGNEKKNGGDKEPGTPSGEKCSQVNGNDRANSESCGADTEKSGPEGGSADKVSETGDSGNGKGASKGGTSGGPGSEQIEQGSSDGGTRDANSVQGGQIVIGSQGGADTSQQGRSDGSDSNACNQGASNHQGGDTGGDKESQEGPDGSGNEGGGTDSDPGEKETQNASWPPFDIKPYMLIIKLKGMEQINNALKFFNEHKERITDAIDTINSLYNTSVSNLKNTFNNFTDFFNNFINNLSIDYNQLEKTPDSGDKQSGSGGTGDKPPTPNAPSEPPKDSDDNEPGSGGKEGEPPTSNDSSQHQKDSPQHDSNKQDSQGSQDQQNSLLSSSVEQTQAQKPSQDTSGNQNSDQTDQEGPQKPETAPVTKQENSGTELKGNRITEIGDIYVLKEYKKIGISIIVILIPITLAILYKYLSFGRRNELKKKNNMKKVINMVGVNKTTKTVINSSDGKKQIQIIIKSSSQKKQTKKFINSVYGEKSPSLKIYQLMQADPVPFINLIFLLIFFVYKRKRDFIE